MVRFLLCDDDREMHRLVGERLRALFQDGRVKYTLDCFSSGEMFLPDLGRGLQYDCYLLDVELPGMSGIELAREIKVIQPEAVVLLLTGHDQYAVQGYEVDAFRFVPKAEMEEKLDPAVLAAVRRVGEQDHRSLVVTHYNDLWKIPHGDIVSIRREGKSSLVKTARQGEFPLRKSIRELRAGLDPDQFVLLDRGCLVNLNFVQAIEDRCAVLTDGTRLPLGRPHAREAARKISRYWGRRP